MNLFEHVLLRLKEQLKVQTDKEVALLLELSPTAFGDRKKRDSFPEDRLFALAARRPELNVDVAYVLTGTPSRAHAVMGAVRSAAEISSRIGGSQDEMAERSGALLQGMLPAQALSQGEQVLLENFRRCSDADKARLIQSSALLAAGLPIDEAGAEAAGAKGKGASRSNRQTKADASVTVSGNNNRTAGGNYNEKK